MQRIVLTFCHRRPDRSFFWRGKQFPVCARCTGVYFGYLSFPLFVFDVMSINVWWSLCMIIPTCIDGITQAYCHRESNNLIRFTTGMLAGVGSMSLISIIAEFIGKQIFLIIKHYLS